MDITDSLFDFLRQENTTTKKESSTPSLGKDINEVTGILMKAFKEADDEVQGSENTVDVEQDDEQDEEDENDSNEDEQDGELIGEFSEIKDEIEAHRENLSEIYERLFKNVISPLFRKLQDFNLNVAFDTTELLSHGIVKIKLSHMNIKSSAKMEINIFANTVNGEFLGLENKNGEVLSTDLNDVSLDDLINILIKVLA